MNAQPTFHRNTVLSAMDIYASKAISLRAKADPSIANLSFGEPVFGPPEHLLKEIAAQDLSIETFLEGVKRYENPRGSLALRTAIAGWYRDRYGLVLDPEREIMVTHGGVEAITLAILSTSDQNEEIAISDPSYMLYARTLATLGRSVRRMTRPAAVHEYASMLDEESALQGARAIIINSPENPTGYVLSQEDWTRVGEVAAKTGTWVIHDEVYDVMSFDRAHRPAKTMASLAPNSILINSFSKKFGLPGLRIGWLVAPPDIIDLAAKTHDYLYLGVNVQAEHVATRLLSDTRKAAWLNDVAQMLQGRCERAVAAMTEQQGYAWPRRPHGAMFLFPEVTGCYESMPQRWRVPGQPVGDAVANWLLEERGVAVVPGSVYGPQSVSHVRMVLCTPEAEFEQALNKLAPR
ncbi:pyridoxal phosphate-dependent aminotransferase [Roseateles sp. DB2]|uniref:pyridoxal phosphate-dependent aminotransferase n=1 Tax=Roseateles sp. DB2 TaxID=3453717 RepID=UPI003EEEED71